MVRGAANLSVGTKAWADKINAAWRASALMVATEVGQHLIDAKAAVPHGDFERMVKDELDFSPQTARKLMAVAADQRIRNRAQGRALPDHWTTYYEMTKLSDDELDKAFETGVINSQMRRADVPKRRKKSPQGGAGLDEGSSEIGPLAAADASTPHDERKGEDSAVIVSTASQHPGAPWGGSSSSGQDTGIAAELQPGNSETRVRVPLTSDARVTLSVRPDAISRLATGLALAMAASLEFEPGAALAAYPKHMLPQADELSEFTTWLLTFEEANTEREKQLTAAE